MVLVTEGNQKDRYAEKGMTAASETGRRGAEVGTGRRVSLPIGPQLLPRRPGRARSAWSGTLYVQGCALNS